jgi:hypothetical protein
MQAHPRVERLGELVPFDAGRARARHGGHAAARRPDLVAAREELVRSAGSPALLARA